MRLPPHPCAWVSVWQGLQLADNMRKDGVLVDVDEAEDMVHAFQLLAPFHSACTAGILRLATFARRMAPGSPSFPPHSSTRPPASLPCA